MFDLNDVEPIQSGELIPDGSFAKVTMTSASRRHRRFHRDRQGPAEALEFSRQRRPLARLRVHRRRGTLRQTQVLANRSRSTGGKVDDKGASIGWNISKRIFRAMIDFGARPRSRGHERGGEGETAAARARRSERHHLCRQDRGRAQQGPALSRPQPARSPRAAEREGMAGGDERRDRPAAAVEAPRSERRAASAQAPAWAGAQQKPAAAPRRPAHRRGDVRPKLPHRLRSQRRRPPHSR